MYRSLGTKLLVMLIALPIGALLVSPNSLSIGQEKPALKTAEKKAAKGRLPANYGDVVDEAQKEKIYAIQAKFREQIMDLEEQLVALIKQQNDEIEGVLTEVQKAKIDKVRAESAAKKKKKAADAASEKPAEEAKPAAEVKPEAKPAATAKPAAATKP